MYYYIIRNYVYNCACITPNANINNENRYLKNFKNNNNNNNKTNVLDFKTKESTNKTTWNQL